MIQAAKRLHLEEVIMNSYDVIQLARKHAANGSAMQSSAQLCLKDAEALQHKNQCASARNRAVKSLEYSVGIFHPDYIAARPDRKAMS